MMTTRQLANRLFMQMTILLVLYAAATLLAAVKFLPVDPLAVSLPYHQIAGARNVLLDLALWTGLFAGGLTLLSETAGSSRSALLTWGYRGWTLLLALSVFAALLGLLEGRYLLELPPVLDIVLIVLTVVLLTGTIAVARTASGRAWWIGMVLALVCVAASLIPATTPTQDRVLRVIAVGVRYHIAYVSAGAALAVALLSKLRPRSSLALPAGLAVAGVLPAISPLSAVGVGTTSMLLSLVVAAAYVFFAVIALRGARAPGWMVLGLAMIAAGGVLGAIQAAPQIGNYVSGTGLSELMIFLMALGVIMLAWSASPPDSSAALAWVAAGTLVTGLAALLAGVVQVYLERMLTLGFLDTQTALTPLFVVWIAGLAVLAVGLGWAALRSLRTG
ncbi:MAG: hypothetical protein KC519_08565 [Anaerolineae bacterium]|nr:hypothetical protein [Anaerolineae bacterium]